VYKLFLTLRYLRKRRIAYFAIAAVMLCVAMVLIVLSVMGGWLEMVKKQARGLLGDVIVDNRAYPGFPLYQEFIDAISTWPEIVKATPVIYTYGLFHFGQTEQSGMVRVVGVRLHDVYEVNAFKPSLFYERYYPGTTHLGEQGQPLGGWVPVIEGGHDSNTVILLPRLPSPYQDALEQARRQHAEHARQTGGDPLLRASDEVETPLSKALHEHDQPPIPGYYASNNDGDEPKITEDLRPGLILGRDIVAKRESDGRYDRYYPRGTLVDVTLLNTSIRARVDPVPILQRFRYVDDSRTGIYDIDSQHVYCDFDLLQKLLEMGPAARADGSGVAPARCSQIQIKVKGGLDGAALRKLTERLREKYLSFLDDPRFSLDLTDRKLISRIEAVTWQQSQAHIIAPVEKEKILVTILFGIISLVAVALILCILYMIVLQKTRDIGIVKALGGSSGGVALIFVIYGAAVGITGSILGTVFGTLVVKYINEIQDFLISINPRWRVWDLQVYSFDRIPSEVDPWDALFVVLAAIAASTIGSLAAAWRAGTMQPVEAIRHE